MFRVLRQEIERELWERDIEEIAASVGGFESTGIGGWQ
jgi:hypothetical protein